MDADTTGRTHGAATPATEPDNRGGGATAGLVFLLSAALLSYEVSLMRMLLVAGWHHFAFLVVSVALLGFGSSGVILYLFRRRILPRAPRWLFGLTLAAALTMPLCMALVQVFPVASRFLPALLARQLGWWLLYWLVLLVPFLLGAAGIGLVMMRARARVPGMYAANLAGSAAGALLVNAWMLVLPPAWLASGTGAVALGAACFAPGISRRMRRVGILGAAAILVATAAFTPAIRTDPYKYHTYIRQLERQQVATLLAETHGPKGVVSVYQSDFFHDLPFLTGAIAPPPMSVILLDGHPAASVLDIASTAGADVMRQTLSAVAYALAPSEPAVLLTDELGGANIWLAALHQARRIDVVHHYPAVAHILRRELARHGGAVLALPGVAYHNAHPRHFMAAAADRYDLIQLVGLETMPAGSGGMGGLGQNHLMTVQGLGAALDRLTPDGVLVATRGIQDPPRDNLKILALAGAALRRRGVADPGAHVVVVRDFLAVCTLVKPTPWRPEQRERVMDLLDRRHLTGVWFDGIPADRLNRPDQLPGPEGSDADWYHLAATSLLAGDEAEAARFVSRWLFDIRPPTDDRPFFHDFSRLATLPKLHEAFGDLWLTRTETAFLFVVVALAGVGGIAVILTLLPLAFVRPDGGLRMLLPVGGYFTCLGLAYLMLEITFLSKLTRLIGDPVQAAATTIAAFLFFSGLGSLSAQRCRLSAAFIRRLIAGLVVTALICIGSLNPLIRLLAGYSDALRFGGAILLVAPLAYLMGFPMAAGLSRLHSGNASLVAWAWAVNGFASVLAAPVATLIGMAWGFTPAALAALALYLIAAVLFPLVGSGRQA